MKNSIFLLTLCIILSCGGSDDPEPDILDNPDLKQEFPDIAVVDISQESDWDYFVGGNEDYYFINANENNDLPKEVLYYSAEADKKFTTIFKDNGLIDKVIIEEYTLVFRNFEGTKVDVGILYPNGDIENLRQVDTNFDWQNIVSGKTSIRKRAEAWSDVVRWTGRAIQGIPCAISAVVAASTGGTIGLPLFIGACVPYLLELSADILENEFEIQNGFTEFVGFYDTTTMGISCLIDLDPLDCFTDLAGEAFSELADNLETLENNDSSLNAISASLETGYGDIQVNLTWDNETDLDLHVIDPNGYEVYFGNDSSPYGMFLDIDDVDGIGPENIFWSMENTSAPLGVYSIYVNFYDGISNSSNYTVLITAFESTRTFNGTINRDETVLIFQFDPLQDGLESKMINKNRGFKISKTVKK